MEMKKTVPWVSGSKSKYFVNVSTKEECDFLCSSSFFNPITSGLKSNEIEQKGIPKFQTKNMIV